MPTKVAGCWLLGEDTVIYYRVNMRLLPGTRSQGFTTISPDFRYKPRRIMHHITKKNMLTCNIKRTVPGTFCIVRRTIKEKTKNHALWLIYECSRQPTMRLPDYCLQDWRQNLQLRRRLLLRIYSAVQRQEDVQWKSSTRRTPVAEMPLFLLWQTKMNKEQKKFHAMLRH